MKKTNNNIKSLIILMFATLGLSSCSNDDFTEPSEAGIPLVTDYRDASKVEVDQSTNNVTFSFEGKGVMPVWVIDGKYSTEFVKKKFYTKAGNYTVDVQVANANGISDGAVTQKFRVEKSKIVDGFAGYKYNSEFNLWKKSTVNNSELINPIFDYAPNWVEAAKPEYSYKDGSYIIDLPEATTDSWQSQVILNSDINCKAGTIYDFSIILSSTTTNSNVTIKLADPSNPSKFIFEKKFKKQPLIAGQPLCFFKDSIVGININNLQLIVDFGGNAANSEVTVEDIVFKDHANDDGTVLPEKKPEVNVDWVDVNSADNLWHGIAFTNKFHYAPNWTKISDPSLTISGNKYSLEFPNATFGTWQNQVKFITEGLSTTSSNNYDFRVTMNASNNIKAATVKFVLSGEGKNDDVFLFSENIDLIAKSDVVFELPNQKGIDISKVTLVFDFGGNPAETKVSIKDIILQKHKD